MSDGHAPHIIEISNCVVVLPHGGMGCCPEGHSVQGLHLIVALLSTRILYDEGGHGLNPSGYTS